MSEASEATDACSKLQQDRSPFAPAAKKRKTNIDPIHNDPSYLEKVDEIACKIQDALNDKFCQLSIEEIGKGFYVCIENILEPLSAESLMEWKSSLPKTNWRGIQKIQGNGEYRTGHYRFQTAPQRNKPFPHYPGFLAIDRALRNLFACKDDMLTMYYLKSIKGALRQFWHADNFSLVNLLNSKSKPIPDKMDIMSPNKLTYSCFVALEEHTYLHIATDWVVEEGIKLIRKKETVYIKPGDMIMMTSNCLHAGAIFSGIVETPSTSVQNPAIEGHYRGFFEVSTSLAPIYENSQYWFFESGCRYIEDEKRLGWARSPPFYFRGECLAPSTENDTADIEVEEQAGSS